MRSSVSKRTDTERAGQIHRAAIGAAALLALAVGASVVGGDAANAATRGAHQAGLAGTASCASHWTLVTTPHPAGYDGDLSRVVSVPNASQAWAVGWEDGTAAGTTPLALHLVNGTWRQTTFPLPHGGQLYGVTSTSASDAWAVGGDENSQPVAAHWNGSTWSVTPTPTLPIGGYLEAVAELSPTNAWAVGSQYGVSNATPLFEHWNGNAWTIVDVADPFATDLALTDIGVVPGTTRAWAIGPYLAYQEVAGTWTYSQLSGTGQVYRMVIPAVKNVWAVGISGGANGITEHFNGSTWSHFFTKNDALTAIGAVSATDIWAAGTTTGPALFEHLVSGAWHIVGGPTGVAGASAMALSPNGSGWAVAHTSPAPGQPQIIKLCGL
jgi:hypothetical protein